MNKNLLADTIAHLGPCVIGFNWAIPSFMYYEEGIYDDNNCPKGFAAQRFDCRLRND